MTIQLRPTIPADLDFVLATEADAANSPYVGQWTRQEHATSLNDPDIRHYIIEHCDDHRPVGYLILAGLSGPHKNIEFRRIVLAEKGKGFGRQAIGLVKQMAFEHLDAHRLWLDVRDQNPRARRLYETAGFSYEGTFRNWLLQRGEPVDCWMFALLPGDPRPW